MLEHLRLADIFERAVENFLAQATRHPNADTAVITTTITTNDASFRRPHPTQKSNDDDRPARAKGGNPAPHLLRNTLAIPAEMDVWESGLDR